MLVAVASSLGFRKEGSRPRPLQRRCEPCGLSGIHDEVLVPTAEVSRNHIYRYSLPYHTSQKSGLTGLLQRQHPAHNIATADRLIAGSEPEMPSSFLKVESIAAAQSPTGD